MVELTDIAAEKVRDFIAGQKADGDVGLRVGVRGGGCSGFQYALALDEQRDDDHIFETGGVRVLVDPASLRYVEGSTVDYTESFMGSGFDVSNPTVVSPAAAAPRSEWRTKSRAAAPRSSRAPGSHVAFSPLYGVTRDTPRLSRRDRYPGVASSDRHR
jgi:iron-sulfur cluster assembly protein